MQDPKSTLRTTTIKAAMTTPAIPPPERPEDLVVLVAEDDEAFKVNAAPAFVDVVLVLNVLTEEDVDEFFEDDVIFDDDVGVDVDDDEGAAFGAVEKNVTDPVAKMELSGIPDGKDETFKFCSSNFWASLMVNSPTGL